MSPEIQSFVLSILIKFLIVIAFPLVFKYLRLLALAGVDYIKAHVSAAQLLQVQAVIQFLVTSAQQTGLADSVIKDGAAKKAWVLSEAVRILREQKLDVFADNVELLSHLIESAVYDNFNRSDFPVLVQATELTKLETVK